jgi:DNA-damage-inducible protein J
MENDRHADALWGRYSGGTRRHGANRESARAGEVIITALGITLTTQSERESPIFTPILPTAHLIANTDIVRAWIDRHIKEEAINVQVKMGLSVSDAIRMCLPGSQQIRGFPLMSTAPLTNRIARSHDLALIFYHGESAGTVIRPRQ